MEYIERKAAIVAIKNLYPGIPFAKIRLQKWNEENKNFMECERAIERIPTADVAPVRHGRWISNARVRMGTAVRLDADGCPVETCHCSECGDWLTASDEYPVRGRYCPNCGARMDLKDGDTGE